MRIAIIGAGISGLVAAYRLAPEHDVTVFEANDYPGGHTNSIAVNNEEPPLFVDTGFIVFNDRTYPNFLALLTELGISFQPTIMSFSVRDDRSGLEYNGHSLNTLFAQRRNLLRPSFYGLLSEIIRFNRVAKQFVDAPPAGLSVGDFLAQHRFSGDLADQYLLPLGSAIWSCPLGTLSQFPIAFIIDFFRNHGLLDIHGRPTWYVVQGGSHTYVRALTRSFTDRIRLSTPIKRVRRSTGHVEVTPYGQSSQKFDHVIFACHSDQALRILGSGATSTERELLSAFPYGRNVAVLHTDATLLPHSRRALASWNYRLREDDSGPASVTYNMNILQGLKTRQTYCVTLNDEQRIDPARILGRYVYHHPIFTTQRSAVQARHGELLNANRTSFCGAYWRNGFHEDGVVSAVAVVAAIQRPPSIQLQAPTDSSDSSKQLSAEYSSSTSGRHPSVAVQP